MYEWQCTVAIELLLFFITKQKIYCQVEGRMLRTVWRVESTEQVLAVALTSGDASAVISYQGIVSMFNETVMQQATRHVISSQHTDT